MTESEAYQLIKNLPTEAKYILQDVYRNNLQLISGFAEQGYHHLIPGAIKKIVHRLEELGL